MSYEESLAVHEAPNASFNGMCLGTSGTGLTSLKGLAGNMGACAPAMFHVKAAYPSQTCGLIYHTSMHRRRACWHGMHMVII